MRANGPIPLNGGNAHPAYGSTLERSSWFFCGTLTFNAAASRTTRRITADSVIAPDLGTAKCVRD